MWKFLARVCLGIALSFGLISGAWAVPPSILWGAASGNNGTNSVTITTPSTPAAGTFLIAFITGSSYQSKTTVTPPSGWTFVGDYLANGTGGNYYVTGTLYTKVATSSEPSSYTWTQTATTSGGTMLALANATAIESVGLEGTGGGNMAATTFYFGNTYANFADDIVLTFAGAHAGLNTSPYNTAGLSLPAGTTWASFGGTGTSSVGFAAQDEEATPPGPFPLGEALGPFASSASHYADAVVVVHNSSSPPPPAGNNQSQLLLGVTN